MSTFSADHVPVYAPPRCEVAGTVMLLHTSGHVALFDADTRQQIRTFPFGDTASPRLHPNGYIYYVAGRDLRRKRVDGGNAETVRSFDSKVTIGGHHGDFDDSFRYLPILRGVHVGILNVETGGYVETPAGAGVDWAQVGNGDVLAVGFKEPERIVAFNRVGTTLKRGRQLAPALGHEDVGVVDGRPVLVTTTSNWRSDWPRGGGSEEWLVAIDMLSGEIKPIRQTHWTAYHVSCWRDWVCVSFYVGSNDIWVGRIDGGGKGRVVANAKGAAASPYLSQPHAAWSDDGRRVYYGEHNNTKVVDVQRNNSDQIPIDNVQLDQAGQPRALDLTWRRKDKLREVFIEGDSLRVVVESVNWPDHDDGAFASLWVFTARPGWRGRSVWPMRRGAMRFERSRPVGPGMAQEFSIAVPLDVLGVNPGEEFALCFGTPTVRSAIVRYTMLDYEQPDDGDEDEPDDSPPPGSLIGAPWPCFPDGRAPVMAMTPTGEMPPEMWGHWLDNIHPALIEMGVDGFHCPMQGRWRPHYYYYRLLVERNAQRKLVTAWWLDREDGDGPGYATEQLRRLITLYDSLDAPGWQVVGPTYDVWQSPGWEDVLTVNDWIREAQGMVGNRRFMIGARARRSPESGHPEQQYVGDYRAYEAHVSTGAEAETVFARAVQEAGGVPVAEFDRFRVRDGGSGKNSTIEDIVAICRASRDRRTAVIIGMGDGRGNVSDVGSGVFPNAAAIQSVLAGTVPPDEPDEPTEPPGPPPTDRGFILDSIDDLQHFRVEAWPHGPHDNRWNTARRWEPEARELTVTKVNDTDETFVLYGFSVFIGMEAPKLDEITAEPRLRRKGSPAGRLLWPKTEEKDSGGMAFDSSDFWPLPVPVRIHPGDEFSGLFQHTVVGAAGQAYAHQAHAHITFYCYRE